MHKFAMPSPFGRLVVTADDAAIRRIRWDERMAAPDIPPTPLLSEARRQLEAYIARELRTFDLPLEPGGEPFEQQVWALMREIPYGGTMTYGEMANRLGAIARNVGSACGSNPIPIVIPCHRVVGSEGKLTGFSGGQGVASKAQLLAHEGALLL
jgi:methylated-DNA-[protein]-cysteine S-methyltransferase